MRRADNVEGTDESERALTGAAAGEEKKEKKDCVRAFKDEHITAQQPFQTVPGALLSDFIFKCTL